jgi:hypothetical protein
MIRNPLLVVAALVTSSGFYGELLGALYAVRWGVLAIVMLIATDLWSGVLCSKRIKKEQVRWSRAIRRTTCKFLEYICYIALALVLAEAIFIPLDICNEAQGAAIGAALALFVEANSIYGHVCALHGIKNPISLKRVLVNWLKKKNADLGEAIEESENN